MKPLDEYIENILRDLVFFFGKFFYDPAAL